MLSYAHALFYEYLFQNLVHFIFSTKKIWILPSVKAKEKKEKYPVFSINICKEFLKKCRIQLLIPNTSG